MTNNIQGNSRQAVSWFLSRSSIRQKRMAWYIWSDEREEPTTPSKTLIQMWWRNQKLSRQAKVKKIQHHQTSFTTNANGTSLNRKYKRRKKRTKNKPKTIMKIVIGSYISIITLKVNGLNAPTERHRLAGQLTCAACISTYHISWLDPPTNCM